MQTVVLAVGEGRGLTPFTTDRPRAMLPVADRPLVAHAVDAAVEAGTSRVFVVADRGLEAIRSVLGTRRTGVDVTCVPVERGASPTEGLRAANQELADGPVLVVDGCALFDATECRSLVGEAPSVGVRRSDDARDGPALEIDDDGRVVGVLDDPTGGDSPLRAVGAFSLPAGTLSALVEEVAGSRDDDGLASLIEFLCAGVDLGTTPFDSWLDVTFPWDLLDATDRALADLETDLRGTVSEDAHLSGPVVVEEGATVKPGVNVEGPVLVREGTIVGPNAFVRGPAVLGPDAIVGHAVEVKHALFMEQARAGHLSYVGDAILGRDTNLGAGTNLANLRHDGEAVRVTVDGERVSTGRRKFGALVGDGAKTGINTSINAGVVLGPGARTAPGDVVLRDR